MESFGDFFDRATEGYRPYPYQSSLATEAWPDVLDVPTGLGKTAAVTLAWLYRRHVSAESGMPRRLIWCLPMRVLVEQARGNAEQWLDNLGIRGEAGEPGKVAVHTLMGGESELRDAHWARYPEQDAVLIGTQDMLLSRALMRGYGMSRYQWPVHFALLHHDALWVFDEVQLMGAGLPTSAQLEAFRRTSPAEAGVPAASSLWVSATLQSDWLATVDFRPHVETGLRVATLSSTDREAEPVRKRLQAVKTLATAGTRFTSGQQSDVTSYIGELADEIRAAHVAGSRTLVIVNRVERAQSLYRELADYGDERLLLHARFRPNERRMLEERLRTEPGESGQIVIATQAVEAGVDLTSRTLFTELAPWASLVQRFGRCNRGGEWDEARIFWIDCEADDKDLLPYARAELDVARQHLQGMTGAGSADLPPVTDAPAAARVLRRRDMTDLFNTDPDLSGFDVDVSPYIRDPGSPQLQVFWREFEGNPEPDATGPGREELCNVSLTQARDHLDKARRKRQGPCAWCWDPLATGSREDGAALRGGWEPMRDTRNLRPGQVLMLRAADGGYNPDEGFVAGSIRPVEIVQDGGRHEEANDTDDLSKQRTIVPLSRHLDDVHAQSCRLADALEVPTAFRTHLATAARWHDVGKAHEAFQRGIGHVPANPGPGAEEPWAKSDQGGRPHYHMVDADDKPQPRPGFRHELASTLAWLEHGGTDLEPADRDLVAYLIAAHHGRVRLGLRALPTEKEPPDPGRLFARGIWHEDRLPPVRLNGESIPDTVLRLDLMKLGHGPQGPSWSERTHRLLQEHGPFRLAWLEALLRIADWRGSATEDKKESGG